MSSRNNFSISVCFALFSFQGTPELISLRSINSERFSLTHSVRHFASRNRKTLGPLRSTSLCVVKVLLSCAFQRWWATFLESLSAVSLYFRLSACFLCLSKLAPHLSVLVGLSGLEPPTSRLSGVRSNRLSYKPISWFERWFPTLPGPAVSYPPVGPPAFFFRRTPFSNRPPQAWWR